MPTFYNFRENGLDYSFDDIFVPADLFREGNLWAWGLATGSRIGNGATTGSISTPVTTFSGGSDWKQLDNGQYHTTAIKTDGTLWLWGTGLVGALGNGETTGDRSTPITTFAGGSDWKQVSCDHFFTAAIKTDGTLWTWGYASFGRLGNGITAGFISTPITTFAGGTNWKQVSCGGYHTAAIKTDGTLWTWGSGGNGRIGNAGLVNMSTPVTTFAGGSDWKQVRGSTVHTSAIKTDGTLWTWGFGNAGRLGNTITSSSSISTPVTTFAGGTDWKQVSCRQGNTSAIKTDGTLWIWGSASNGRLGNGVTIGNISTPVTTFGGGTNWKQVSVGTAHAAAIKTDGTLWTWGSSTYGRIGSAITTGDRSTPITTFAGGSDWKQASAGDSGAAALTYIDSVI